MKRFINFVLATFMVALAISAHAGNLILSPQGQQAGVQQYDSTDKQWVQEVRERGKRWALPVTLQPLSGTSGTGITMTGASTNYKGAYYLRMNVTSTATVALVAVSFVAEMNGTLSAAGEYVLTGKSLVLGPLQRSQFVHARGLTATAIGNYQIGWDE